MKSTKKKLVDEYNSSTFSDLNLSSRKIVNQYFINNL